MRNDGAGSLTVVGTGIQVGQLTPDARTAIECADEVLYLVADPVTVHVLERLRPDARSLQGAFSPGLARAESYTAIVRTVLERVHAGAAVCAVFYGHPGVLVRPAQLALEQARREGFAATMLPGVSSLDCLFADLVLDPAEGLQGYEASSFLAAGRAPDEHALLVLWQVGVMGDPAHGGASDPARIQALVAHLARFYPGDHEAIVYEAAPLPFCDPVVTRVALRRLGEAELTPASTLVLPPKKL